MPTNEHKTCQQPWEVDGAVSVSVCALIERPDEKSAREREGDATCTRGMNIIFMAWEIVASNIQSVVLLDSLNVD